MRTWLRKHWKKVLVAFLLFLLLDGTKSYLLARRRIAELKGSNVRLSLVYFVGVWNVSFKLDAWHKDAHVTYTVTPVLPLVIGKRTCK